MIGDIIRIACCLGVLCLLIASAQAASIVDTDPVPTKADIRALLREGSVELAETGYMRWADCWREDDPALLREVLRASLLKHYRAGEESALAAMIRVGDVTAVKTLSAKLAVDGASIPTDCIDALRGLGARGGADARSILRLVLARGENRMIDTAIETLALLGDRDAAPDLERLFEDSPLYRRVLIARALAQLRAAGTLQRRYLTLLNEGDGDEQGEAVLILAAGGYAPVADDLRAILQRPERDEFRLALYGIDILPGKERPIYLREALRAKDENVQRAALANLHALPDDVRAAEVRRILTDAGAAADVRMAAIDALTQLGEDAGLNAELCAIAGNDANAALRVRAMLALPASGEIVQYPVRASMRKQLAAESKQIAIAARAALLGYALLYDH